MANRVTGLATSSAFSSPGAAGRESSGWRSAIGPGALIAVGYVDPGNWATDLAGGSRFGYLLLSVVVASSLVAMLLQTMSTRLAIATGTDLAQASASVFPRARKTLWLVGEIGVIATDLAEVLGSALALQLLFGVPLVLGVLLTVADVGLLLLLERRGVALLSRVVAALLFLMAAGFAYELALSGPQLGPMLQGLVPHLEIVRNPQMLYMAVGIIGATVMPHNLYLHSHLAKVRPFGVADAGEARIAARKAATDTAWSLGAAMLMNAALVILAASTFHRVGRTDVGEIADAHRLLAPLLGSRLAPVVFALTLLAAGQSATVTGTMAGQTIMSGFLHLRWPAWKRRLVTRACAVVPAVGLLVVLGDAATGRLLILSQVVLSLALPFAVVPLVVLTSQRARMGALASPLWMRAAAWASVAVIIAANVAMIGGLLRG
jgi:manganese transport protein